MSFGSLFGSKKREKSRRCTKRGGGADEAAQIPAAAPDLGWWTWPFGA